MNTAIIVQARMTSTRLPGKILKTVLDKPLLEYQIERLRRVKYADSIIIATTVNETDQPIVDFCNTLGISFYRGSEDDVLSRYFFAAEAYNADVIVRVTSDCPLIDPEIIDNTLLFYKNHVEECDYVSNSLIRTYPRGMDTEIFSMKVLKEAYLEARDLPDREHVTSYIYRHEKKYRLANVSHSADLSHLRLTVDTPEDYKLIRLILEELFPAKPHFNLADIIEILEQHPDWPSINSHIEQKQYGQ